MLKDTSHCLENDVPIKQDAPFLIEINITIVKVGLDIPFQFVASLTLGITRQTGCNLKAFLETFVQGCIIS